MDRRDGEPERLKALVKGDDWARLGTETPTRVPLISVRTTS